MAKALARLWGTSIALLLLSALGCQQPKSTIIEKLPAPNLDGPLVNMPLPQPRGPATKPTAAPQPLIAQQRAKNAPAIPQDWLIHVPANQWQYIVIHHSATPSGSAAAFDRMHRAKGWDELGYHFVIGNGTMSGDGQIEVG